MAAYARRDIRGGAIQTTLSSGITNADTAFTIAATTGWPTGGANGDFIVVIDPGTASEEKVLCASRSTTSVTVQTSGRGVDGTSAAAHSSGATVYPVHAARDDDEANLTVSKTIGLATAVGQIPVVDAANSFAMLQAKTSGNILQGNGTTVVSNAMSGDVTITNAGVTAIGASKVTSTNILNGTIVDADVSASAAISLSKIAPIASTNVTDFAEAVADTAGAMVTGNTETGIAVTYQDADNTVDYAVRTDNSTITVNASNDLEVLGGMRYGCTATRVANQSVNSATATFISWDTQVADTTGFFAPTSDTITLPASLEVSGGIYAITCRVADSQGGSDHQLEIVTSSAGTYTANKATGATTLEDSKVLSLGIIVPLAAGDTIKVKVWQTTGNAENFTGRIDVYRVGA